MPKTTYVPWKPRPASVEILNHVVEVCEDFAARGYTATLRQVYYQMVARNYIPNTPTSYDNLGNLVSNGRRGGFIDWNHIVDRTRSLRGNSHWSDPASIIRGAARGYAIDTWTTQPTRVEVWVEKDALVDVVAQAAEPWDVDYFSCRGYTSDSEIWRAAQRLENYVRWDNQDVVILHLGDHDPSGIDMTRDIEDRLRLFGTRLHSGNFEVRRIALNRDQIEQYDPPPNPAKTTDARYARYQEEHGEDSWELDALDPDVLRAIIDDGVASIVDMDALETRRDQQGRERDQLNHVVDRWSDIVTLIDGWADE